MSLTARDIAEIARLLDESAFASLDLKDGDFRLRIRRDGARRIVDDAPDETALTAGHGIEPAPAEPPQGSAVAHTAPGASEVDVVAPLLGNYYAAPRPGEDPFVAVGDTIGEDTVVAIIEVMKLMNSVRAGVAGTVVAVLAENGSAVEAGQPLIRVRT